MPTESIQQGLLGPTNVQIDLVYVAVDLLLAAVLAGALGVLYVRWGRSHSDRRGFAAQFVLLAMTTTLVITVVKSSLALSLGLVGALSIVRFRSAVKEHEELVFLFLAIAIGLCLGADQRALAVMAFVIVAVVLAIRHRFRGKASDDSLYLSIRSDGSGDTTLDSITAVLTTHGDRVKLKRYDTHDGALESTFLVQFPNVGALSAAEKELRSRGDGVEFTVLDSEGTRVVTASAVTAGLACRTLLDGGERRFERKYVVRRSLPLVERYVLGLPAQFRPVHHERTVHNVYFDTPSRRFYHEHVWGVSARVKVRVRWYDELGADGGARLEVKGKDNALVVKQVFPIRVADLPQLVDRRRVRHALREADLPYTVRELALGLEPALVNRYVRRYFLSRDGRFRITLDTQQAFARPGPFGLRVRGGPAPNAVILELKYAEEHALDGAEVAAGIRFPFGKHSKYVTGMQTTPP